MSSIRVLVVLLSSLMVAACAPNESVDLSDLVPPDTLQEYAVDLDAFIDALPEDAMPTASSVLANGIGALGNSGVIGGCLGESRSEAFADAVGKSLNLSWGNAKTAGDLKGLVHHQSTVDVLAGFGLAVDECAVEFGGADAVVSGILGEIGLGFSGAMSGGTKQELARVAACMQEMAEEDQGCGPIAQGAGTAAASPTTSTTAGPGTVTASSTGDASPQAPKTPQPSADDSYLDEIAYGIGLTNTWVVTAVVVGGLVGGPIWAAGGTVAAAVGAGVAAVGIVSPAVQVVWDWVWNLGKKECPANPYVQYIQQTGQFAAIAEASYLVDGAPATDVQIPTACLCVLESGKNMGICSSPGELRLNCLLNPWGPDDAPRPECMNALFLDAGLAPPLCPAIDCPAGKALSETCTCEDPLKTVGASSVDVICPALDCPLGTAPLPTCGGCQAAGVPTVQIDKFGPVPTVPGLPR